MLLDWVVTVPNTKPAVVMAVVAAAWRLAHYAGNSHLPRARGDNQVDGHPAFTRVPAAGLSLITSPDATVLLGWAVTVPNTKPTLVMAAVAAACVSPTTLGTATCAGPEETTRLTADPALDLRPGGRALADHAAGRHGAAGLRGHCPQHQTRTRNGRRRGRLRLSNNIGNRHLRRTRGDNQVDGRSGIHLRSSRGVFADHVARRHCAIGLGGCRPQHQACIREGG